jgi:hypothetical protein
MFVIPKTDKIVPDKSTQLQADTVAPVLTMQPNIYIVQSYPLPTLYAYEWLLFDPFLVNPRSYKITRVYNNTDAVLLSNTTSLASLSIDKYLKQFNTLTVLTGTNKNLQIDLTVFTTLNGQTTDISAYTQQGFTLQSVNITGHLPEYTVEGSQVRLNDNLLRQIQFPIKAALNLTIEKNSDSLQYKTVYTVPTAIGFTPDYILYADKFYSRSRNTIPLSNEFTYTSTGALLWI